MTSLKAKILLDELCVKLGFCLPPAELVRLANNPPRQVEKFVEAVFAADGVDPGYSQRLYRQVRDLVTEHFHRWEDDAPQEPIQSPETTRGK